MKFRLITLAIFLFFISLTYGQRKPKIRGSRLVIETTQELDPFTAIELNDDLDIVLRKASDCGYSLVIDDNLVDILKFRVEDETLKISSFYNIVAKKKMEIIVYYNTLNALTMVDGKIEMKDHINTDALAISTYGSSKLQLNVDAQTVEVMMLDNSFAELNIVADTLNMSFKDRVDAEIFATTKVQNFDMYKNAQLKINGNTEGMNVNLFENASLKASDLDAGDVTLALEASSSAYIKAFNNFSLSSKDSAKTYLYGPAAITIVDFLNTSQLNKR
ncbi:DUF2807 domain-containing protein [Cellulophaga baltica]|jgi:hypothetical protein|uniref:DUF2807 domain-containing protein n=1 Tax=Cellulophaga baltica TaxID=76594 RepID=UPI0021487449|nr:DUF2807 domain-containing protein [Cellulophaga baltica]MCR1023667.1 DUF2807 domain-containing protein [Cellulophaga baltica]